MKIGDKKNFYIYSDYLNKILMFLICQATFIIIIHVIIMNKQENIFLIFIKKIQNYEKLLKINIKLILKI